MNKAFPRARVCRVGSVLEYSRGAERVRFKAREVWVGGG